jgi:hypothetical protein
LNKTDYTDHTIGEGKQNKKTYEKKNIYFSIRENVIPGNWTRGKRDSEKCDSRICDSVKCDMEKCDPEKTVYGEMVYGEMGRRKV